MLAYSEYTIGTVPKASLRFNKTTKPFIVRCINVFGIEEARYIDVFNMSKAT